MTSKIAIALAATALAVSVLVATPLGQAAGKLLPKNSVRSAQVANGSLQLADLSANAKSSLKGQIGPQGLQGVPGPKGDTGPAGISGREIVYGPETPVAAGQSQLASAMCPAGKTAIGGGGGSEDSFVLTSTSGPWNATGWAVIGRNYGNGSSSITALAVCAFVG